jgi:DNA-binding transcriptional LysR family regulator
MQLSTNEAIKQAVISGLGISLISKYTLGLETKDENLKILDVIDLPNAGYWYLVYPTGKQLSPITLAFINLIKSHAKQISINSMVEQPIN